jgi:GH35 family endo-1,4-beta-xylanase
MKHFKNLYVLLTCIFALTAVSCGGDDEKTPATTTNTATTLKAANPDIKIGSLIYINSSKTPTDLPKYKNLITREFNSCQTSWFPGFNTGWLAPGFYDFDRANENINYMVEAKLNPWVHLLFGPNLYEPDWLIEGANNGTYNAAQLETLMKDMIDKIMESNKNKDKVEIWNVLNEVFLNDGQYRPMGKTVDDLLWAKMGYEDDQSGLTGSDKINAKHPIFIRKAFEYCRAKTTKKLELRDYSIESNNENNFNNRKHKAFYQLVKHMKNAKIPIDAISIQGHFVTGKVQEMIGSGEIQLGVKKFKDLGVLVYISELDIGTKGPVTDAQKAQQKKDYYDVVKQCVRGGATIINLWGLADEQEAGDWRVGEGVCVWDKNYVKKPAYDGVLQALKDTYVKK